MQNALISVIMSTYNETAEELNLSISSILNQTYRNIQFIIIDDNPSNLTLHRVLESITDSRVEVHYNIGNIGLVASLNKALKYTKGQFIARMDADDIAVPERLEKQLDFMFSHNLDMVGTDLEFIDENGDNILGQMHYPTEEKDIFKYIRWGNCIAHPTWLVKKEVYENLNGYRNVPSCEDYDFILRVLACGKYHTGNVPFIGLKYRIRNCSISRSNISNQYLLKTYLAGYKDKIQILTQEQILAYMDSEKLKKEKVLYENFLVMKKEVKKQPLKNIKIIFNKYFYLYLIEKKYFNIRK